MFIFENIDRISYFVELLNSFVNKKDLVHPAQYKTKTNLYKDERD